MSGSRYVNQTPVIRPIRHQILLRQDLEEEKHSSGLYLPQGVRERWRDVGTVLAIGPKVTELVPGERVYFQRKPDSALNGDGLEGGPDEWKDLLILEEGDILFAFTEDRPIQGDYADHTLPEERR